jgi:CIC family chloride channel protein
VGAAAAIAAAFNTPMAAVLFALEEVVGDLHAPVLGSVVLASATSWAVLRLLLGNNPLFHVPQYELVHPLEFGIYAVLGVAGGFLSVAFTKLLLGMRKRFLLLPRSTRWWHPVVGGVLVGLMGWFVTQVLGVGYSYVGLALDGTMALKLMVLLVVLKLFAITTSYASGNAGGIFVRQPGPVPGRDARRGYRYSGPSLVAHLHSGAGSLRASGHGGALRRNRPTRAPMTAVLMIFEMTRDYAVIVPLMIANLASLFISARFQKEPIYEALAQQDGIHLPSHKTREELGRNTVQQVMRNAPEILPSQLSVQYASERMRSSEFRSWIMEDKGTVVGVLSSASLESALANGKAEENLMSLFDTLDFPHVHADHPLHLALERMSNAHIDVLPVAGRADIHKLEGIVTLRDVLDSYGVEAMWPRK